MFFYSSVVLQTWKLSKEPRDYVLHRLLALYLISMFVKLDLKDFVLYSYLFDYVYFSHLI